MLLRKGQCLVGEREVYQKRSFLGHRGTYLLASHTIPILRRALLVFCYETNPSASPLPRSSLPLPKIVHLDHAAYLTHEQQCKRKRMKERGLN